MDVGAAEEVEAEGVPAVMGPLAGVPGWDAVEEVLPMVAMRVRVPQRQMRCRCVVSMHEMMRARMGLRRRETERKGR